MREGTTNTQEAELYPIAPRHGVYLTGLGLGDDARIAAGLREVLQALPLRVRRKILSYWKAERRKRGVDVKGSRPHIQAASPIFVSTPTYFGEPEETQAIACVFTAGHELKIDAAAISEKPEEYARYVYAHELAHVYQWASGQFDGVDHDDAGVNADVENEADILAAGWGFPCPVSVGEMMSV